MEDEAWFGFFRACAEVLDVRPALTSMAPVERGSWCVWTTFDRLKDAAGYWSGPLPTRDELAETHLGHGANWSQYFHYQQLCHVLVPRTFSWERVEAGRYQRGEVLQDIDAVAEILAALEIPHRLTPLVLEIKTY